MSKDNFDNGSVSAKTISSSSTESSKERKQRNRKKSKVERTRYSTQCKILLMVLALISFLLLIIILLIGYLWFPKYLDTKIVKTKEKIRTKYINTTVCRFYFFNITNPEQVRNGYQVKLEEIGPYVYNVEVEIKGNYKSEVNKFDAVASSPLTEDDKIFPINIIFLHSIYSLLNQTELNTMILQNKIYEKAFNKNANIFLTTTIKEFFHHGINYCVPSTDPNDVFYTDFCKRVAEIWGLMNYGSEKKRFSIPYFHFHMKRIVDVIEYYEATEIWRRNEYKCNEIRGIIGGNFPKRLKAKIYEWYIWFLCRQMKFAYNAIEYRGNVRAYRFVALANSFHGSISENRCYCIPGNATGNFLNSLGCYPDGAIDVTNCVHKTMIMSFPHFLHANEIYHGWVNGLNPDPRIHESFAIVEPTSGILLHSRLSFQQNVPLRSISCVNTLQHVSKAVIPLLWYETEYKLPDSALKELDNEICHKVNAIKYMKLVFGILSLSAFIILLALAIS
ncbi:sensory neuron membrane protein 2-like [Anthonomus grandis grandis]|uniref:sensory neuron membrane protein 2-like n=1 Tax=Anthonomus grandis grandis TaxID=2921223 RepID=UPI0021665B55|nr:sensory neuron membrane protein 2-like [Anthonomus grandis grandis]